MFFCFWQVTLERLVWMVVITLTALNLIVNIVPTIRTFFGTTIDTTISLRKMEEVPFPAVIIDLGEPVDHMGFIRDSKNMAVESDIPLNGWALIDTLYFFIFQNHFLICCSHGRVSRDHIL